MSDKHSEATQRTKEKHNGTWSGWADNKVRDEGACTLSDGLKTNTTLTELNLICEQQGHTKANKES